jgi:hypothetical protein
MTHTGVLYVAVTQILNICCISYELQRFIKMGFIICKTKRALGLWACFIHCVSRRHENTNDVSAYVLSLDAYRT